MVDIEKILTDQKLGLSSAQRNRIQILLLGKTVALDNLKNDMVKIGESFSLCKYVVTEQLWDEVEKMYMKEVREVKPSKLPKVNVSWEDAVAWIEKLNDLTGMNYRLPWEHEWEWAAKGGNKSRGFIYAGSDNPDEVAWYHKNAGDKMHPVGEKKPNALELYDMSGNVWELCKDSWGSFRVYRGGSWNFLAEFCRVASRCHWPEVRHYDIGFRLAHD